MKLLYTNTALRQIDDALSYTAARSPQGAENLRERILSAASLIAEHPRAAMAASRANTRRMVLSPYPYVLFFHIGRDEVIVSRLRHTSRKPLSKKQ